MTDQPKPECVGGDIVERVARALFDREWNKSTSGLREVIWLDDWQRDYFRESARAALEAIPIAELVGALSYARDLLQSMGVVTREIDEALAKLPRGGDAK